MKGNLHTLGIGLFLVAALSTSVLAQQQKTGYVNTDLIIAKIPEYKGIQQELQSLSQEWRNDLKEMQREIDQLKEEFATREILYTEEIRKQREQEIQNKIRVREEYLSQKFGPEGDYFLRQQELLEPIQRKIFEAITVVAEREGYDFVIDRAMDNALLFARPEWNLNDEVMRQMGISSNDTSN